MATLATITKVDAKKFETALVKLKSEADSITVNTPDTCLQAKTLQRDIRNYLKDAHAAFDPFVNLAKRSYDDAKDERSKWIVPGETLDEALAAKVKDFERKEREKALREQEEINRKKREAEAAEADRLRKEQEAQARADREKREKEIAEARKAGDLKAREAEKLRKDAEALEKAQREQAAKDAEAAKANFQPVTVAPSIPKVSGVPSRINYRFRIIDANKIPRQYLCPDEMKIGVDVRAWKKTGEVIPGVEAYED